MKLLYFDVETTGLSAAKCAIHQLSGIIEIDGKIVKEFNFNIRPYKGATIDDKALSISNVTREQIMAYKVDYKQAYKSFSKLICSYIDKYDKKDKFFLVGYNNASFDNHFLRALWLYNQDKYFGSLFWANPIDVYILASHKIMSKRHELSNFKLLTACQAFGIETNENEAHNAIYDVYLTRQLFKQLD